ncbi:Glucose-1-phosphate thymidylyltransferase 2 [Falsiruegeria litorea R37]|uniref:glucose-1-phosphate thymidylyltransferase n=1 Tax=Falsiruegeria litorea R37 TaxID=1200284 RepID=A0A1Y5TT95_9RHOB|nr:sugar phosphate nucleotidyltransferase [Falsiruegeria litorea]SLN67554.1 Glucose-1-phosphate thymidylyltransferase 2 [Falsiruegeria litorea R37]
MTHKGIILAGGNGTRLRPLTTGISKPLLPVYDKPMIYYPISVLMMAGIRDIAIITSPQDQPIFQRFLGDGRQWGVSFTWIVQPSADGIAQAYTLAEGFLDGAPSVLVLGDNLFFGPDLAERLQAALRENRGGTIFAYQVEDPKRYGVVACEGDTVTGIVEKPEVPPSNFAITGLYILDGTAPERARRVEPSNRGELEIVSLLESYLTQGELSVERLGQGYAWFDAGTHQALLEASCAVQQLQQNGQVQGSPDQVALRNGWTSQRAFLRSVEELAKTETGAMLSRLIPGPKASVAAS